MPTMSYIGPYAEEYKNLCWVNFPSGTVNFDVTVEQDATSSPGWLLGVPPMYLADLSGWGFTEHGWWPGVRDSSCPALQEYQSYDDPISVVSVDMVAKFVYWSRPIRNWSAEEIEADITPKRAAAMANLGNAVEYVYDAFVGQRRTREQPVLDAALRFAASGYAGDVPEAVAAIMEEKLLAAPEATDEVIAQFDNIDGVLGNVFAKRIKCEAAIRASKVNTDLNAAVSEWNAFMAPLCAELRIAPRPQLPTY